MDYFVPSHKVVPKPQTHDVWLYKSPEYRIKWASGIGLGGGVLAGALVSFWFDAPATLPGDTIFTAFRRTCTLMARHALIGAAAGFTYQTTIEVANVLQQRYSAWSTIAGTLAATALYASLVAHPKYAIISAIPMCMLTVTFASGNILHNAVLHPKQHRYEKADKIEKFRYLSYLKHHDERRAQRLAELQAYKEYTDSDPAAL